MSSNTNDFPNHSQPPAAVVPDHTISAFPRRIWIAILLGLFTGPLAQVYCGRFRRAICLIFISWLIAIMGFVLCCYLPWGLAAIIALGIMVFSWRLYFPIDAAFIAYRSQTVALKSYQRVWAYILIAFGFLFLEYGFLFVFRGMVTEAFYMPTRGMNLTLLPGDRFLVDKMWYRFASLKRGDIVAFRHNGPHSDIYAHRVIGLPGDVVEIRNEELYLNGDLQKEPYAQFTGDNIHTPPVMMNFDPLTVPEGQIFEMGDSRRRSVDSRLKGCIPIQDIVGRVQIIYWSEGGPEQPDAEPDRNRFPTQIPKNTPERIRWERIGLRLHE